MANYELRMATEADRGDIIKFLANNFFKDEPLTQCTNYLQGKETLTPELEIFALGEKDNGLNVLAMDNQKIIGISLNVVILRNDVKKDLTFPGDPLFTEIITCLRYAKKEADIFSKYPQHDKGFCSRILSVDSNYRNQGIGKALLRKSRELAKENECGFMAVECSSAYTAMALKKLGFRLDYTLPYEEYKVNGKVRFQPQPPHYAITFYSQELL